jgi:hypothetical protein
MSEEETKQQIRDELGEMVTSDEIITGLSKIASGKTLEGVSVEATTLAEIMAMLTAHQIVFAKALLLLIESSEPHPGRISNG